MPFSLFGVNISFGKNGQYVKQNDCHIAQDAIKTAITNSLENVRQHTEEKIETVHQRIDDIFKILLEKK